MEINKIIIDGLSVITAGKKEKQAIIFLHGLLFDKNSWINQIEEFSADYYCVSLDIRGFGESIINEYPYTNDDFADDVFTVIKALKINKPIICGLSMGGYIAFRALEKDQSKFSAAIFCNTRAEGDSNEAKTKRAGALKVIRQGGLLSYVRLFFDGVFGETFYSNAPDKVKQYSGVGASMDKAGVINGLLAIMGRTSATDFLQKIKIPTLLISGEEDLLTPPSEMESVAEKISGAYFAVIKEAGHMSPIENAPEFNKIVKSFFSVNKL